MPLSEFPTDLLSPASHIVETERSLFSGRGVVQTPCDWSRADITLVPSPATQKTASQVLWSKYRQAAIDPIIVRFQHDRSGGTGNADMTQLGAHMKKTICEKLCEHSEIMNYAARGVLRVALTLTGIHSTGASDRTPAQCQDGAKLSSATASSCRSASINAISLKAMIYDGASNRLLHTYEAEKRMNPIAIATSFGAINAARRFLTGSANALAMQIRPGVNQTH
ncbi:DUF3313 family protein [Caballeronia sp. HLA56]